MKRLLLLYCFLYCISGINAQNREFTVYPNGLIYSENTMLQLGRIVDSLNIKFRSCGVAQQYYSQIQARAHYVLLDTGDVNGALADMKNNMPFEEFLKKYPQAKVYSDIIIIKNSYITDGKPVIVYFDPVSKYGNSITLSDKKGAYERDVKDTWVFKYERKTSFSGASVSGYYFITEPVSKPLADKYQRLVQYADCMIDTAATIYTAKAMEVRYRKIRSLPRQQAFISYVHKATGKPEYPKRSTEDKISKYYEQERVWDSLRFTMIDTGIAHQQEFKTMLESAIEEALENTSIDDEFEEYVGRYASKNKALQLKRNRTVVGFCSMDSRPRVHAVNIALLSAETVNWEIFLRAHLDIMNDRFERASDNSIAQHERRTYFRELEVLNINAIDLLLGICLRINNPGKNHYQGSIYRVGKALAETSNNEIIENALINMITDKELDDHNRVVASYLYSNYIYYLNDQKKVAINNLKFLAAIDTMPGYLTKGIKAQLEKSTK